MTAHRFKQFDVFTRVPFAGNPVAVVFDGDALDTAQMQAIARWTNLSETTFVCQPTHADADYRLRIFTPGRELPFAGHPTLGSARAVLEAGLKPKRPRMLTQECTAGLVDVRIDDDGALAFKSPTARLEDVAPEVRAQIEAALGAAFIAPPKVVDLGPRWLTGELASAETVLALKPDFAALALASEKGCKAGVNVFGRNASGVEVRSFFAPNDSMVEDPVCGSGNAAVAVWLDHVGSRTAYSARQGRAVGRDGYITVQFDADAIWVGGHAVVCVDGMLHR